MFKSIYNMVISILGASFSFLLGIIGIIFNGIHHNSLGVIFCSLYTLFMILYYIFQSISFYDEDRVVFYRLSKVFCSIFTTLITIYLLMLFPLFYKWILLAFMLLFLVFEIILDSIGKIKELKYLLSGIKLFIVIFLLVNLSSNFLLLLGIFATSLFYISNILGEVLQNKIIMSFSLLSVLIFGIIIIFL